MCYKNNVRRELRYHCEQCVTNPGLCAAPCFLRYHTLINYEYALKTFIFVYSLVKEALRKNIVKLSENVFFSWEVGNGGIILTREPEIIIVTYIYVPWAPRHICCDVYIRPVGFKGLMFSQHHLYYKEIKFSRSISKNLRVLVTQNAHLFHVLT